MIHTPHRIGVLLIAYLLAALAFHQDYGLVAVCLLLASRQIIEISYDFTPDDELQSDDVKW